MGESQALQALDALAQETRLRIVRFLVRRGPDGANAGEIAEAVGAISSRASFHLSALSRAGLVRAVRRSRQMVYSVDFAAVGALVRYLVEDCCDGNALVRGCCEGTPTDAGLNEPPRPAPQRP